MTPTAVPTETVLIEEYRRIWPDRPAPASEAAYRAAAFADGQAALCLSGGGIRSAAFALGVLQGLSAKGLLDRFHYLSTVSGGGYIGCWLQRWIHDRSAAEVMAALAANEEPAQVKALRENSNYITPRIGIGSNDTWTAVAMSVRNILINGMLFAPVFLLVGLVPNLVANVIGATPGAWVAHATLLAGGACLAAATMWTCLALPSYRIADAPPPGQGEKWGDKWVNMRVVLPLVLWGVLATIALSPLLLDENRDAPSISELAAANFLGIAAGVIVAWARLRGIPRLALSRDAALWIGAAAISTIVLLVGTELAVRGTVAARFTHHATEVMTTLGPLLAVASQLGGTILFVTFRSAGQPGEISPDADREWLGRLSALKLKPALLWALIGVAAFGINGLLDYMLLHSKIDLSLTGIVTVGAGAVAVLGGRSSKSGGPVATGVALLRHLPMQVVVALATAVFALALFTLHARAEQTLAKLLAVWMALQPRWPDGMLNPWVVAHLLIAAGLLAVLHVLSRRIQVNRFSLNGFYRNRLARAFLGGARQNRTPDPFTGFDPNDNVRMHNLLRPAGEAQVLYPVINVALNVTDSDKLAWQERKAEPFVFTPLYSGSELLMREEPEDARQGAFLPSDIYGGNEPDLALDGSGVTLATAMAISGAAASPNRGYHSSPATAFLMSLFNVRLGAWLPNPARAKSLGDKVRSSGPSNNLRAMLRDLAGSTQDNGRDIYLSDGGHFDNLGLYEMVRRRCRYIVVSDAGCDPECSFADLGAAVRKALIDQNVRIEFAGLHISKRGRDVDPQFAYALGTITYPGQAGTGRILYIKPSFFGELPVDVRAYAAGSPTFPHEPTSDQFFSESQFESYRALGRFFTMKLGGDSERDIAAFFDELEPAPKVFAEAEAPIDTHLGDERD